MALEDWAKALKRDVVVLWLAARDPRVPWYAKTLAALVTTYALSPIDLIPDFIPVIGLLDDLLIVPAGIWLARQMIAPEVIADLRRQAESVDRPKSAAGLVIVVGIWVLAGLLTWGWWWRAN